MNKELAIKVYTFILKEMNGYSQELINELTFKDMEGDPIFEGLLRITALTGSVEK